MVEKFINFIKWLMYEQPSLSRLTLERAFNMAAENVKSGRVLEIGGGEHNCQRDNIHPESYYLTLNLLPGEKPDIVGDACIMPLCDNSFDSIIMLEVLEHIPTPAIIAAECWRVLRSGGVLIASTRFIYPQHGAPCDYYRFTDDAMARFFGAFAEYKLEKLGNRWHAVIDILTEHCPSLRIFNRLFQYIRVKPASCYCGLLIVAKK
jgi:SAM-dependent methyltransferase